MFHQEASVETIKLKRSFIEFEMSPAIFCSIFILNKERAKKTRKALVKYPFNYIRNVPESK